jgi:hypothetical protein
VNTTCPTKAGEAGLCVWPPHPLAVRVDPQPVTNRAQTAASFETGEPIPGIRPGPTPTGLPRLRFESLRDGRRRSVEDAVNDGEGGQAMRVVLDLKPGAHPISGTFARPATGDSVDFNGTLELLALLEATVTTAPQPGRRASRGPKL